MPIYMNIFELPYRPKVGTDGRPVTSIKLSSQFGMNVSGSDELFSKKLEERLALAGFTKSRRKRGDYRTSWNLKPTRAALPVHLLKTLGDLAHFTPDSAVRERFDLGTKGKSDTPGGKPLTVGFHAGYFFANCDDSNKSRREFLEGAGWIPFFTDPRKASHREIRALFGDTPYVTREGLMALNLEFLMSPEVKTTLLEKMREENLTIKRSYAKVKIKGDPDVPLKEGERLDGFQDAGVNNLLRNKRSGLIYDDMGLGKSLSLDSDLPTPDGWIKMGEVKTGDFVIGSNGKPVKVIGVYPQGKLEMFKVRFSDGSEVECCDEHLWSVNNALRKKRGNPWRVLSLRQIRETLNDRNGNNNHYIPMISPIDYDEKKFTVDPYLLGALLGDGGIKNRIIISTQDEDMIGFLKETLPEDLKIKHKSKFDYGIVSLKAGIKNPLIRALKGMNLLAKGSDNKFIPPSYMIGSIKQRERLLQGLLDTDGYVSKDNVVQFSSNSKKLADDVALLVMSFGGNARKSKKTSKSGKDHHIITISLPDEIKPFRIKRKSERYTIRSKYKPTRAIVSVESVGLKDAQCIAVDSPDRLYATNDYVLTHNTVQGIAYSNARPDLPRILVVCKANMKLGWKTSFERFSTRPHKAFVVEGTPKGDVEEERKVKRRIKLDNPKNCFPNPSELIPLSGKPDENKYDVVIINYDLLSYYESEIRETGFDLVILDEIHNVSNQDAQRTRVLFGDFSDKSTKPKKLNLSPNGVMIGLSGTPHPVIERMWAIISSFRPDVFGTGEYCKRLFVNRYAPKSMFVKEFTKGNKKWHKVLALPGDPIRHLELNRRLRACGLITRRLKIDMEDLLPPKSRFPVILPYTFTPEEVEELGLLEGDLLSIAENIGDRVALSGKETEKGSVKRAEAIINVVAGVNPKSPEFFEISRIRARIGEIKAPYVADYVIDEMSGEDDLPPDVRPKTVIFAHHKSVVKILKERLEKEFPGAVLVYDGSVSSDKKRFDLEMKFQKDDKYRIFIMSLSGASGITLTRANRLYMAELDWDATNLPQIEDRIWRMTQEKPCYIGYFMVPNSLDVQMGNVIIKKMTNNRLIYDAFDIETASSPSLGKKAPSKKSDAKQGEFAF